MTKEEVLEKVKFHTKLRGLEKNTQDEYYCHYYTWSYTATQHNFPFLYNNKIN